MCWGHNDDGQLGDGFQTARPVPGYVYELLSGVSAITAGNSHTCALKSDGAVVCWGQNRSGQIGNRAAINRLVPTAVAELSSGVSAISAGAHHTCAVKSNGAVVCWGYAHYGQLGNEAINEDSPSVRVPIPVSGLSSGVSAIGGGESHTCAMKSNGAVVCWGFNQSGQLGDGTATSSNVPVPVVGYP